MLPSPVTYVRNQKVGFNTHTHLLNPQHLTARAYGYVRNQPKGRVSIPLQAASGAAPSIGKRRLQDTRGAAPLANLKANLRAARKRGHVGGGPGSDTHGYKRVPRNLASEAWS